ncbi:alpha/beta fold hydrolase [Haloplanus aerogenes]|uniref:Alpha/beta hydrolase n=1 Tax=Haloplanus aerogenes TaxID=660522 RepID=A0A3M0DR13_9EURY|nr:alpha/beta hydrolase [Haloplanus aerogenes]AZH24423.1 alpha/beta hydrolase [Haloplanus aerogenes]RMB23934.1 pimeloyl-ACP methyl ester carboxylesterase [Haloplanus aerogenes]
MPTVTSPDGTRIAYERHGDGPPLVLLHGGLTRRYWEPLVPQFAGDFTVVTPDRRGRGESDDTAPYSIEREVEDTRAVVDAVAETPVLFGHSFGGLQAIETARVASVEAVVAYEPAYLVDEYRETADLAARMQARLDAGEPAEATKLHLCEVLRDDIDDIDDIDAWLDEWPVWPAPVDHVENTIRMNRALENHPLPDSLDVDAPVLLLTGSEGPSHLRESVRAVHDALPDSRLVEFEGVGHSGPTEAPDRTVEAVRDFLATVTPARSA